MPRPSRLNKPGIPQHVVQRGNNRQACFLHDSDYLRYLRYLKSAGLNHQCSIHAYALMGNHVHLLVTPKTGNGVSRLMMELGRRYVRYFNDSYGRTGTLWEGRFKSSLVLAPEYCMACYRYIEMNPVRAGMVAEPGDYPWSSYRFNGQGARSSLITPHSTWLGLGACNDERSRAYRALFGVPLEEKVMGALRVGIARGVPIGGKGEEGGAGESRGQVRGT